MVGLTLFDILVTHMGLICDSLDYISFFFSNIRVKIYASIISIDRLFLPLKIFTTYHFNTHIQDKNFCLQQVCSHIYNIYSSCAFL